MNNLSFSRREFLTEQYVWGIQNEGTWYNAVCNTPSNGAYGPFRRITGDYIHTLMAKLKSVRKDLAQDPELSGAEWAFVRYILWVDLGGTAKTMDERDQELLGFEEIEAPVKLEVFATCGEARTLVCEAPRAGKIWEEQEKEDLYDMLCARMPLQEICVKLARTSLAICERGVLIGVLKKTVEADYVFVKPRIRLKSPDTIQVSNNEVNQTTFTENEEMNYPTANVNTTSMPPQKAFETKVIIFGRDAANMTEQELINAIKQVEGEIARLKEVKTKSKKIAANIADLESQLASIVEVLDAR
jgi:hypothetical protein